jgi:hypothetical protein
MRLSDWRAFSETNRITKTMHKAVSWLNRNQKRLEKSGVTEQYFDYPDYWGMPKTISRRLSPDEVDWLQYQTNGWC